MAIANPFDFSGRSVLVTGAGKGIGLGIAQRFAEAGANVAFHFHTSRDGAERAAEAVRTQGGKACALQADLNDPEQVRGLMEQARSVLGSLDGLINNAGAYVSTGLLDLDVAEWDQIIAANLRSAFLCTQAAAKLMTAQGTGGAIVNIASIEANHPAFGHSHYSAAKAGLVMLTRSAALELAPQRIRVNAVLPGLIGRGGIEQDWPEGVRAWEQAAPLRRLGTPRDVADACLFLVSDSASWITGISLDVDGGVSVRPAF